MFAIKKLTALEILDSRGRPTVRATCQLASGAEASCSVPSGASTGAAEARELRDGDPSRYCGLGCKQAVTNVTQHLHQALAGQNFKDQQQLDAALLALDGTPDKSNIGANSLLSVSLAFARAVAVERGVPLYHHFAEILGEPTRTLPRLTINLFSGGKHGGGQTPIQDVLLVPAAARTIDQALASTYSIYQSAAEDMFAKYKMRLLRADEGGLAPPFSDAQAMLDDAITAIELAGFMPGSDVALALDVASTHFFRDEEYHLGDRRLTSADMIDQIIRWTEMFPIVSVEDGLAQDDWTHWPELRRRLSGRALTVGDDLLCTNPARIQRAINLEAADALLLKVNQIGTLSEARDACLLARAAGWQVTVSARSGETEDNWLADLAVGWSADQIKIGSITQSERLSKYNRLLEIEAETHFPVVSWPRK